jgi:hypothetical protein
MMMHLKSQHGLTLKQARKALPPLTAAEREARRVKRDETAKAKRARYAAARLAGAK